MYQDQESIKAFERHHARDRVVALARSLNDASSDDADIFAAHARAEDREGRISIALSLFIVACVVLVGAALLFWD